MSTTPSKHRIIFAVGNATSYLNWTESIPAVTMEEADAVLFAGGEDCWPGLYGHKAHPTTSFNLERDRREVTLFKKARALGKPMIGTCRGAQLGCCLSGGKLVQHQENRSFWHPMFTHDGKVIRVTSTHHQAAFVWDMPPDDYRVLGWTVGQSAYHQGQDWDDEVVLGRAPEGRELEEVYYPKTRFLGLQHHSEMAFEDYGYDSRVTEYIDHSRRLLDGLLAGVL